MLEHGDARTLVICVEHQIQASAAGSTNGATIPDGGKCDTDPLNVISNKKLLGGLTLLVDMKVNFKS